jgi:hypothetical protein
VTKRLWEIGDIVTVLENWEAAGGAVMTPAILLVTWFYYGQPPSTSQTQFTSMQACQTAREAIIRDAARLRADADRQIEHERAKGIVYNPVVPTVSVVCAVQ